MTHYFDHELTSLATALNFPADNFCIWRPALPRYRPCRVSRGRKPIPRGRCAWSSLLLQGVVSTSSPV